MENQRVRLSLEEYKKLLELRGESYNGQQPNHLGKYRVTIPMEEYIQIQKAFGKIEDPEEVEIPKSNSKVISDIISRYTEEELKQVQIVKLCYSTLFLSNYFRKFKNISYICIVL